MPAGSSSKDKMGCWSTARMQISAGVCLPQHLRPLRIRQIIIPSQKPRPNRVDRRNTYNDGAHFVQKGTRAQLTVLLGITPNRFRVKHHKRWILNVLLQCHVFVAKFILAVQKEIQVAAVAVGA